MHEIISYRNALGSVVWHPAGYIRLDWEPMPMAGPAFRELFIQAHRQLVRQRRRRLYTDRRGMPPIWPHESAWLGQQWLPKLAARVPGCRIAVLVERVPEASCCSCGTLVAARNLPLEVSCFDDPEYALTWLQSKELPQRVAPSGPGKVNNAPLRKTPD